MPALTQDEVLSALKQCYDPEIPVNIVDLGLIYGVRFESAPEDQQDVTVEMTLTAQGCPSHVMIGEQVKARVEQLPGVRTATVNVVWTPPWTPERLSPDRLVSWKVAIWCCIFPGVPGSRHCQLRNFG